MAMQILAKIALDNPTVKWFDNVNGRHTFISFRLFAVLLIWHKIDIDSFELVSSVEPK